MDATRGSKQTGCGAIAAIAIALLVHPNAAAAEGSAAAGLEPPAARVRWSVAEAGADATGAADATASFQRLLDEAGRAGGGIVEAPAGRYRIDGGLSIPAGVTLQGTYRAAPTIHRGKAGEPSGSVLLATAGRGQPDGPPFVRLAGNDAVLAGWIIQYPEWKQSDVPPVPYPPCILSRDTENVAVLDCLLLNPWEGIRLVRAHRHHVRNVTGYPIRMGLHVDECYSYPAMREVQPESRPAGSGLLTTWAVSLRHGSGGSSRPAL